MYPLFSFNIVFEIHPNHCAQFKIIHWNCCTESRSVSRYQSVPSTVHGRVGSFNLGRYNSAALHILVHALCEHRCVS